MMRGGRIGPRALACALLLALAAAAPALAQSPLSLVNVGAPAGGGDARVAGRGGWGLAESDTLAPCFRNPAGLPGLQRLAIVFGGYADAIRSSGEAGSRKNWRVMAPDMYLALPLSAGRAVVAVGFHARRSTQFSTAVPQVWMDGADTVATGKRLFDREGTQFAVPLIAALRVSDRFSVSAALNLERGVIREIVDYEFTGLPPSDSTAVFFRSSALTRTDDLTGTSATFGVQARPLPGLALGATYTTPWTYDVSRSVEVVNVTGTIDSSYTLRMPRSWAVGASVTLAPRWRAGADYEQRAMNDLRGRADWERDTGTEWTFGCGIERGEARVRRAGLRNLPLRFGVSRGQWGYAVGGNPVREWRVAAGTGFVFQSGGGRVDVALSYGRVGDRGRNGYADDVWRLAVSLAGLERWW